MRLILEPTGKALRSGRSSVRAEPAEEGGGEHMAAAAGINGPTAALFFLRGFDPLHTWARQHFVRQAH